MARITQPALVKHFVGILYSDKSLIQPAISRLCQRFGEIDYKSPVVPFDVTSYYEDEMGKAIFRIFISFKDLIFPDEIVESKLLSNNIEGELAVDGKRKINLDPGYMDYHKIVLASAKFAGQKIYIGKGIYADLTLYYKKGWQPFDWGFPDFRSGIYNEYLGHIRTIYKKQRKKLGE